MDRENVINSYSKKDFMSFLSSDNNCKILELFNNEGINIIRKSKLKEERIEYTLTYSPYKNELLQNKAFLDTNIYRYYGYYMVLTYKHMTLF